MPGSTSASIKHDDLCVWVVVLSWNNYQDTAECLSSLQRCSYPNARIVLVDNGSTDGSPERLAQEFPQAVLLRNSSNLGVPAGYNTGLRYAFGQGADAVLLLNNDTLLDPNFLSHLVAAAHEERAGILVPAVYYQADPQRIWSAGARARRFPPLHGMVRKLYRLKQGYHALDYAIACCILITRQAVERAGMLDETIFFMWEDLEFSLRIRRAGFRILQVPESRVWHKVSRTTRPESSLFWRMHGESGAIFYRRHSRWPYPAIALHLGYFMLREVLLKRQWKFMLPLIQGLRAGLRRPLREIPMIEAALKA